MNNAEQTTPSSDLSPLFEMNLDLLNDIYGSDFIEKTTEDSLTTKQVIEANEVLIDKVYGSELAKLLRTGKYPRIMSLRDEIVDKISIPTGDIEFLDFDKLGIVLVRPELFSRSDSCIRLLQELGYTVILNKVIKPTLDQYISLYPHGLAIPESYYDFPTRTLNYVERDSRLLVVARLSKDLNGKVSTTLTRDLKGIQGTYRRNTLRGDIATTALGTYIDQRESFTTPQSTIALDPIGIYRKLVRGDIASNGIHDSVEIPLLFYAGQGVHMPDESEIERDLRILCSQDDVAIIFDTLGENQLGSDI
jgi:hypothetical protein